jgi:hypothetical protein
LPDRPSKAGAVLRQLPFAAVTFGHVVLAVNVHEMHLWRVHKRVHVTQYERWGSAIPAGPPRLEPLAVGAGPAPLLGQPV